MEATEAPELTLQQRLTGGVVAARLCLKDGGDVLTKVLVLVLQIVFLAGLTFYAATNSSLSSGVATGVPSGGVMFLYALCIGASWVVLTLVLQVADDRNVVVAGKFGLLLVLHIVLLVVFIGVLVASIVAADTAVVGFGILLGYFVLTWVVAELLNAAVILAQFKFGVKPRQSLLDPGEDEHASNRGTFAGVDPSAAVSPKASTDGGDDDMYGGDEEGAGSGSGGPQAGDDDLGLL